MIPNSKKMHGSLISILATAVVLCLAPAAIAQETPDSLAALWLDAIKDQSQAKIMPLIHPSCSEKNINKEVLERLFIGELPPEVTISTQELKAKAALAKVYEVAPEMQLNLNYITHSDADRKKYGIGKGFPIAQHNSKWYFVICTHPNLATP